MSSFTFSSGVFTTDIPEINPSNTPKGWDYERFIEAAGFDPADEEINICVLIEAWGGYVEGTLIICGCTVEGHDYTIAAYKNHEGE